jgi:RNA polymerase sigma-70 factor (ECF subfamily)
VVNRLDNPMTALPGAAELRVQVPAKRAALHRATPGEVLALVRAQMPKLAAGRDVDELLQIASEQALRALSGFEGRSQLSTWTFRICYLTVRKHERWHRRWLRRFQLTVDGELPEERAQGADVEDALEQRERVARLQRALEALSTKRRAAIVLHDLEGLDIEEAAGIVGTTPAALRSRLRDARRKLGELLRTDPYFGDTACRREAKK